MTEAVGFVGLGNMGSALAANLAERGRTVVAHDIAGAARTPTGVAFVESVDDVARVASTVVLSLPHGEAAEAVAEGLAGAEGGVVTHVVDTSTVGLAAARRIATLLESAGIGYVDAPVSGGVAGARRRTLAVMYAGRPADCDAVLPILRDLSDHRFHVGGRPGLGQVTKLANNFLSATALAATSEAVAFAVSAGVDMTTVLEVLNASSGQSAASRDKFVNHVLPETYSSGFANTLMAKDLGLYAEAVRSGGTPSVVAEVTTAIWRSFAEDEPGVDFTRIHPYIRSQRPADPHGGQEP